MTVPATPDLGIDWHRDMADLDLLVRFFLANVQRRYISHGEVQGGRAADFRHWSPRLEDVLREDVRKCLRTGNAPLGNERIAVALRNGRLAGIAMVDVVTTGPASYSILQDVVVGRRQRGHGVGDGLIAWVEARLREEGIRRVFLESGHSNTRAHAFLHREGYRTCSLVMTKEL